MSSMIASRICHDLVSPMGAISNGLELLSMSKDSTGPELELITQSIHSATTRLRLYRIAFGTVSVDQQMSRAEIVSVLKAMEQTQKHAFRWNSQAELSRKQVRLVFLLLLCLETVLPWGGRIEIHDIESGIDLIGISDRLKIDDMLWHGLETGEFADPVTSARVQFLVAHAEILAQSAILRITDDAGKFTLSLRWN